MIANRELSKFAHSFVYTNFEAGFPNFEVNFANFDFLALKVG